MAGHSSAKETCLTLMWFQRGLAPWVAKGRPFHLPGNDRSACFCAILLVGEQYFLEPARPGVPSLPTLGDKIGPQGSHAPFTCLWLLN